MSSTPLLSHIDFLLEMRSNAYRKSQTLVLSAPIYTQLKSEVHGNFWMTEKSDSEVKEYLEKNVEEYKGLKIVVLDDEYPICLVG